MASPPAPRNTVVWPTEPSAKDSQASSAAPGTLARATSNDSASRYFTVMSIPPFTGLPAASYRCHSPLRKHVLRRFASLPAAAAPGASGESAEQLGQNEADCGTILDGAS